MTLSHAMSNPSDSSTAPRQTVSIIIPTRNRDADLLRTVESICRQTAPFDQLIVVDQSPSPTARPPIEAIVARRGGAVLRYIHDTNPKSAGMARNRALPEAWGDIVVFFDDDVELEEDFLAEMLLAYRKNPSLDGVSGIITNYSPPPTLARLWETVFAHGPFRDERQPIYWNAERLREAGPIPVRKFTGCLMSFKGPAARKIRFDERVTGAGCEDTDFSERISARPRLAIAPSARLAHHKSPINRSGDHWLKRYVEAQAFLYRKLWAGNPPHRLAYSWLNIGCAAAAMGACLLRFNSAPWRAYLQGLRTARSWGDQPAPPEQTGVA